MEQKCKNFETCGNTVFENQAELEKYQRYQAESEAKGESFTMPFRCYKCRIARKREIEARNADASTVGEDMRKFPHNDKKGRHEKGKRFEY